jgi:NAD(P)-dependent dehydrogenase (short-subunit alcohol dehydrogenase family)
MDIRFDGKVAVVTGGSSGIGFGCAEALAACGAKVAILARNPERLAQAEKRIREKGDARAYQLDVTNVAAIGPTVSQIRADLGEIDVLVCNAGGGTSTPAVSVNEAEWDNWTSINLKGAFFFSQAVAVQSMIPRKSGAIIHMASQYGLVGARSDSVYCAGKGGIVQLTRAQAIEWAPYNIRINAVAPTYVVGTNAERHLKDPEYFSSIPLRRGATLDDVANAVCFLLSDKAKIITGVVLPIDGGWTAR